MRNLDQSRDSDVRQVTASKHVITGHSIIASALLLRLWHREIFSKMSMWLYGNSAAFQPSMYLWQQALLFTHRQRNHCVERISLCVCICIGLCSSGRTYISGITCPNFTKLSMLLTTLVFLWRHFDTLCTSFFIFTVRCYASAVLDMALCLSVRLCVTSRCYRVLLKRLNVGSHK